MPDEPLLPAASEAVTLLVPSEVLAAFSDPARLALMRLLADGEPRSVQDLAARLGRAPDGISKHLRVLRDARVIRAVTPPGSDGRKQYHDIPALFRTQDRTGKAVLDFGVVLLRPE